MSGCVYVLTNTAGVKHGSDESSWICDEQMSCWVFPHSAGNKLSLILFLSPAMFLILYFLVSCPYTAVRGAVRSSDKFFRLCCSCRAQLAAEAAAVSRHGANAWLKKTPIFKLLSPQTKLITAWLCLVFILNQWKRISAACYLDLCQKQDALQV